MQFLMCMLVPSALLNTHSSIAQLLVLKIFLVQLTIVNLQGILHLTVMCNREGRSVTLHLSCARSQTESCDVASAR